MTFDVLRASDKAEWDSVIEALPVHRRDIHFTSAYGRVQEYLGCEALLAVWRDNGSFIAQPFIKRAIPSNPARFDLCNPYGYGGPISSDMAAGAAMFYERLCEWCVGNRIVTEFCNLHPLFLLHQKSLLPVAPKLITKDIIIIDLNNFSEDTVSRRVPRGIRKAKSAGGKVVLLDSATTKATFAALYKMSMDRLQAADRWRFPTEYLEAHYEELSAKIFQATDNNNGERMLMVIGGYSTAYAHFLGSNGQSLHKGLDELLYSEAARMLREHGYERFHLGGGTTREPDDKLLAFKAGFSPDRWKLASYTRVFDEPEYAELNARKLADEITETGHASSSDYFPAYRRDAA